MTPKTVSVTGRQEGQLVVLQCQTTYEHPDVFENLKMKCNVVLKAAHGQPAAFDIDHVKKLAGNSRFCLYAVLVKYLDTLLFMFLKSILCSSSFHLFDQKYRQNL